MNGLSYWPAPQGSSALNWTIATMIEPSAGPSCISVLAPVQSQPRTSDSYSPYDQPIQLLNSHPSQTSNHEQSHYIAASGSNWQQNAWQAPGHEYSFVRAAPHQHQRYSQMPYPQYQHQQQSLRSSQIQMPSHPQVKSGHSSRTSTPSPPPEFHRHWDAVVASFLSDLGLTQALQGFENDMLVMNEDWERQRVPKAIGELMKDLMVS